MLFRSALATKCLRLETILNFNKDINDNFSTVKNLDGDGTPQKDGQILIQTFLNLNPMYENLRSTLEGGDLMTGDEDHINDENKYESPMGSRRQSLEDEEQPPIITNRRNSASFQDKDVTIQITKSSGLDNNLKAFTSGGLDLGNAVSKAFSLANNLDPLKIVGDVISDNADNISNVLGGVLKVAGNLTSKESNNFKQSDNSSANRSSDEKLNYESIMVNMDAQSNENNKKKLVKADSVDERSQRIENFKKREFISLDNPKEVSETKQQNNSGEKLIPDLYSSFEFLDSKAFTTDYVCSNEELKDIVKKGLALEFSLLQGVFTKNEAKHKEINQNIEQSLKAFKTCKTVLRTKAFGEVFVTLLEQASNLNQGFNCKTKLMPIIESVKSLIVTAKEQNKK